MRVRERSTGVGLYLAVPYGQQKLTRTILEVLRNSAQPMTVRDIADVLITRAGRTLDRRETNLVVARARNAMPRLSDRLEGELRERTTFWRVRMG